jgi:hypothetical protein
MEPLMLKIGTLVTYSDHSNRPRQGVIDRTSSRSGQKLYRVNDRWFEKSGLKAS